jgi:hypothetical protein
MDICETNFERPHTYMDLADVHAWTLPRSMRVHVTDVPLRTPQQKSHTKTTHWAPQGPCEVPFSQKMDLSVFQQRLIHPRENTTDA